MTDTPDQRRAARDLHLPLLLDAWQHTDQSRHIRALINAGPKAIATIEAFTTTIGTGRTSTPAPTVVITDRHDPRIPAWATNVADRLADLNRPQIELTLRWMTPESMRHMTVDLLHGGPVQRVTARFDTPNDAEAWLATPPPGYVVLYSHVRDLRAVRGQRVVAQASVTAEPTP